MFKWNSVKCKAFPFVVVWEKLTAEEGPFNSGDKNWGEILTACAVFKPRFYHWTIGKRKKKQRDQARVTWLLLCISSSPTFISNGKLQDYRDFLLWNEDRVLWGKEMVLLLLALCTTSSHEGLSLIVLH